MGSESVGRQPMAPQEDSTTVDSIATRVAEPAGKRGGLESPASAVVGCSLPLKGDRERAAAIIPVGQEPDRQGDHDGDGQVDPRGGEWTGSEPVVRAASIGKAITKTGGAKQTGIRNPGGFHRYKNRLSEIRTFTLETMGTLRRAEIAVWLAIHNCQMDGVARISRTRLSELAGTSERHVSIAVKSLGRRGLLEVLFKGRYQPNGSSGHGLAALYRVYPRPEPRLLEKLGDD